MRATTVRAGKTDKRRSLLTKTSCLIPDWFSRKARGPRSTGTMIGAARRSKKSERHGILISCLDLSNKIWLTMEWAKFLSDGNAEVGSGMGIRTLRAACGVGAGWGVFSVVAAITLPLGGCGEDGLLSRFMLKPDRVIVERRPDPVYDQFFPYYVEL